MTDNCEQNEVSHCEQISNNRAVYEAHVSTEKGLIELGKQLAEREKKRKSRDIKYEYLVTSVKELEDFNGAGFIHSIQIFKDKNLILGHAQSLISYVNMFKELYSVHIEDISNLNKDIEGLKAENSDTLDMVDKYISEIDELEGELNKSNNIIEGYEKTVDKLNLKIHDCTELLRTREMSSRIELEGAMREKHNLYLEVVQSQKKILELKEYCTKVQGKYNKFIMCGIIYGLFTLGHIMYSYNVMKNLFLW